MAKQVGPNQDELEQRAAQFCADLMTDDLQPDRITISFITGGLYTVQVAERGFESGDTIEVSQGL